ncbi:hypothetical protein B1H19_05625 [Streptomyces gilvosporeus]|uniref:Uncharacterized protein n=1 Tax=Streptomyces gilvosporeus TaxID=553510 RepID=A0A1V0TLC5_9ACTN|nr:hypothetical protein B1H19_05625 [Streptomyces gilvosporeus]
MRARLRQVRPASGQFVCGRYGPRSGPLRVPCSTAPAEPPPLAGARRAGARGARPGSVPEGYAE